MLGIVLYGLLIQLAGMWFVTDKLSYTIGLWFGVLLAVGMAINMASVIYDSVVLGDADYAKKRVIIKSMLRYLVVVILFFILGFFEIGNLFMGLIGVFGLKFAAYAQPIMAKVSWKLVGDNWMYPQYKELTETVQPDPDTLETSQDSANPGSGSVVKPDEPASADALRSESEISKI